MERRGEELRLEIARAAMNIFVRDGDTSATVERIAEAAGVAPRTFYRHFAVKEDVVLPLFRRSTARIATQLRTAPQDEGLVDTLVRVFRAQLDQDRLSREQRAFLGLMMTNPQYRMRWIEIDGVLREAVEDLLDRHLGPTTDSFLLHLAAELIASTGRRAYEEWLTAKDGESVDSLLRRGFHLVLDGFAASRRS
jgi:AcrR family transcriptional regulator